MTMTADVRSDSVTIMSVVTVLHNGTPIGEIADLVVGGGDSGTGGTITVDTTAQQMRTCSFQCLDPDGVLTPTETGGGILEPIGVEVAIEVGFLINGTPVLYPQGVFQVTECDTATGAGGGTAGILPGPILTVTGSDRSLRISAALFDDTFTIPQGTAVTDAINLILASQAPWVTTAITPTSFQVAQQIYAPGDDPWTAILNLATAAGMVAYFDPLGVLVVRTDPAVAGSPTALALAGGPECLLADITVAVSNSPGYNGIIVVGTSASTGAPVSGFAYDMDPNSPLYALGTYGKRPAPPVQVSSPIEADQCTAMAQVLLPQVLGLTRTIAMDMLPTPFLDAYDLCTVDFPIVGANGTYIVQSMVVPMDYSTLQTLTVVPLGTPITQLEAGGISVAQFASGGSAYIYSPFTNSYSFVPYGQTGTPAGNGGAFGAGGLAGLLGLPGHGIGWGVLWNGGRWWQRNGRTWGSTSTDEDV